jgi:hypothetical protein
MRFTAPVHLTSVSAFLFCLGCAADVADGLGATDAAPDAARTDADAAGPGSPADAAPDAAPDAVPADAAVAAVAPLYAAAWDGAGEALYTLDDITGQATRLGHFDGLDRWTGDLWLDGPRGRLVAIGTDAAGTVDVFTFDVPGAVSARTPLQTLDQAHMPVPSDGRLDHTIAGFTDDGHAVTLRWTGAEQGIYLLDPATGVAEPVGALAGFRAWNSVAAFDAALQVVYAIGIDEQTGGGRLFSFSLATSTQGPTSMTSAALAQVALDGVRPTGELNAGRWSGPPLTVAPLQADGTLGAPLGEIVQPPDPDSVFWAWNMRLSVRPSAGLAHAVLADGGVDRHLFTLDLTTGAVHSAPLALDAILARQ